MIRFNSATTFRLWKRTNPAVVRLSPTKLQFCHNLSVMETRSFDYSRTFKIWLQFCHNLSVMETRPFYFIRIPPILLQFCHNLSVMETQYKPESKGAQAYASILPQPFGYGNRGRRYQPGFWQLGFNSATTFRLWKLRFLKQALYRSIIASILPQPFGYGNWNGCCWCTRLGRLQFCHNLSVMETPFCDTKEVSK
ncbi:hypothetical protein MSBRW_1621 [Methanosarcina barkeri str. Wiesmoor]|uniref:Uncharacterized protein n=2 Tax=Methanosarcina barkeri TaxID=2208 RepID=A0A0E3QLN0_METBA|nr:hypothetical protein MSBRW_1621 [Methanosarcina barkeri str. Wiesmoor]